MDKVAARTGWAIYIYTILFLLYRQHCIYEEEEHGTLNKLSLFKKHHELLDDDDAWHGPAVRSWWWTGFI